MKRFVAMLLALMFITICLPAMAESGVTFTIWVPEDDGVRDAAQSFFWDYITENTGINLEVIGYSDAEQAKMMFASREFPDMICGSKGVTVGSIQPAGLDGDMLDLEPVIEQYSPTLKAIYEKNQILLNGAKIDGHLYTLPVQIQEGQNTFRDQWMYVAAWLEEIGREVPTTMDELMDTLVAIKAAAGTGTIPETVYPLYIRYDQNVGGQFDILAAFGVPTGCNKNYTMADPDGNVVYQAMNPDVIPALKWIQKGVQNGVIPLECFTNSASDYLTIYDTYPPTCFLVTAYSNADVTVKHPMDVPTNNVGLPSYIRRQSTQGGNPLHVFAVFNTENVQKNIAEVGRLIEFCAQPTTGMTEYYGKQEIGVWWQNEDGTYSVDPNWNGAKYLQNHYLELGPNNRFICVLPAEFYETQYTDPTLAVENSRGWAYVNLYKDNLPSWDTYVYAAPLDEDDTFDLNELNGILSNIRKETFTTWFTTDADIDAEWDAFITRMKDNGVDEWLALKQKAYDRATGR